MSGLRVDPMALNQLAEAFRVVAASGLPAVSAARTGHAQLDEAISELRSTVEKLGSGSQQAADSQANSILHASDTYQSTEQMIARMGGLP